MEVEVTKLLLSIAFINNNIYIYIYITHFTNTLNLMHMFICSIQNITEQMFELYIDEDGT